MIQYSRSWSNKQHPASRPASSLCLVLLALGSCDWRMETSDHASSRTRKGAEVVQEAATEWRGKHGASKCPEIEDLARDDLITRPGGHDSWGRPFKISCSGVSIAVTSAGNDGLFGTGDDVVAR